MNNKWYLGSRAKSITVGVKLPPVTKIILNGKNNKVYTAGTDLGYIMELTVPTATQQMANDLLEKAQGFEYQSYYANTAHVPPEVELGDGIEVKGIYSLIASREYSFTPKITENISAPYSTETDHDEQYIGTYEQSIDSKVELGTSYGGFEISPYDGVSISDNSGNLSMYQDPSTGQLVFTERANIDRAFQSSHLHSDLVQSLDRLNQNVHTLEVSDSNLLSIIKDTQGNVSTLQQTTYSLSTSIKSAQGDISKLEQSAYSLSSTIKSVQGDVSKVTQTANSLSTEIKNAQGDISKLQQTATSLTSDIKDAKGNISTLQQTATSLTSEIRDAENNISTLQQTSKSLTSQISDAKGNISTLQQTAKSLTSQITDAKGNISTLQQTATTLSSQISTANGNISTLQQKANNFSTSISNIQGDMSKIDQYAKSLTLSVTNGKESSTISLKAGSTTISSKSIEFTGMVTFSDLEGSGTTKINGANITTGTISADRIDVNSLRVKTIYTSTNASIVYSSGNNLYIGLGSLGTISIQGAKADIKGPTSIGTATLSGNTIVGSFNNTLGFFGSSGSRKKSVSSNATVADLISALKAYNLV